MTDKIHAYAAINMGDKLKPFEYDPALARTRSRSPWNIVVFATPTFPCSRMNGSCRIR
jgi:hypothetical protein